MATANARLTVHARRLLITRVIDEVRPVAYVVKDAYVVKELSCSRAIGYKSLARWAA